MQAFRRGRRAAWLVAARWEELLARPLDEVRRRLRIEATSSAHPEGIFRADRESQTLARVAA